MLIQIIECPAWKLPLGVRTNLLLATAYQHREHAWPTPCVDHDAELNHSETSIPAQSHVGVLVIFPDPKKFNYKSFPIPVSKVDGSRSGGPHENLWNGIAKDFGLTPDFDEKEKFMKGHHWKRRTFVEARGLKAGKYDGVERADYFMYLCQDKSSIRKRNGFLEGLVPGAVEVKGSAFIFKTRTDSDHRDDKDFTEYISMGDGVHSKFDSEFDIGMDIEEFKKSILTKLMEAVLDPASANKSVKSLPR